MPVPDLPEPNLPEKGSVGKLEKRSQKDNVKAALSFLRLDKIGEACVKHGWSVEESIGLRASIAFNPGAKDADRLRADEGIYRMIKDAADMVRAEQREERTFDEQGRLINMQTTQTLTSSLIELNEMEDEEYGGIKSVEPAGRGEVFEEGDSSDQGSEEDARQLESGDDGVGPPFDEEPD
jgi:hypothetical protein